MTKKLPVLFLDLDGTVRKGFDELEPKRFVNCADDVELFPRMRERLLSYKQAGWRLVGVTNQGGIATGMVSYDNVRDAIVRTQKLSGDAFDRIIMCQHHPDAKDPEYANCFCRKPKMGMLVLGQCYLNEQHPDEIYPPHLMLMVGDRPEDENCAKSAGITFMSASDWRAMPFTIKV